MVNARACWLAEPGRAELRDEALPPPAPGEVRVRTLHSGVSRGTEGLVFRGEVPASEHQRMRAPFQRGDFPAPVKYGYVNVGIVEQGPTELLGRTVFCLYPHQTLYNVPAEAVHPLPPSVPAARAVLTANLETAVNALWDASPRLGDRITVVGAGTLGL
ncbi:MAG: dehydrogenase, partial [Rhizobacter sp.]|nr:dehydrogenase [Rhizobacter sp.]